MQFTEIVEKLKLSQSGIVDWKLAFNNYERTGYIIPDGGRLFLQNIASGSIGTSFALNVWGYEG